MTKGQGYYEEPDPRTGKAPKHQAAAKKGTNNVSNAEIKQRWESDESDKIKKEIGSWNPEEDKIDELSDLFRKLEKTVGVGTEVWNPDDPQWIYDLDSLPIAEDYQEFIEDIRDKNMDNWVWTIDYQGNALVGDELNDTDDVDNLDGYYPEKHDFTSDEVKKIETEVDAKMLEDEPSDEQRGKIYRFDDGSEWLIFEDSDEAERKCVEYVKEQLDDEPGMFNQDWLQNYISMTDTDIREIAGEEAKDYAYNQIDDDDAMKEANLDDDYDRLEGDIDTLTSEIEELEERKESLQTSKDDEGDEDGDISDQISDVEDEISNKESEKDSFVDEQESLVDKARETIEDNKYDEICGELENPVQYFIEDRGMYDMEELMKADFITIDTDEASQNAVDEDGVAHFFATYDGNETELDNGMVMYRTN